MRYKIITDYNYSWVFNEYPDAAITCSSHEHEEIESIVEFLTSKGWKPLGGISHFVANSKVYAAQAMILEAL